MVVQLKYLFSWYELLDKVITYAKNEVVNLSTSTMALTKLCFMFYCSCHGHMLPFVIGMPSQSVIRMLPLTLKDVWWNGRGFY
jgi:hypothetical protein